MFTEGEGNFLHAIGFTDLYLSLVVIRVILFLLQYSSTRLCLPKYNARITSLKLNLLAPELFFLILAHPVYKM